MELELNRSVECSEKTQVLQAALPIGQRRPTPHFPPAILGQKTLPLEVEVGGFAERTVNVLGTHDLTTLGETGYITVRLAHADGAIVGSLVTPIVGLVATASLTVNTSLSHQQYPGSAHRNMVALGPPPPIPTHRTVKAIVRSGTPQSAQHPLVRPSSTPLSSRCLASAAELAHGVRSNARLGPRPRTELARPGAADES
jgi:hypothetical protein